MYFLGRLCKREHEYENSGGSLRYSKNKQCVACAKENAKKQGDRSAYFKEWEKAHPESAKRRMKKYRDKIKKALAFYEEQQVAKNN